MGGGVALDGTTLKMRRNLDQGFFHEDYVLYVCMYIHLLLLSCRIGDKIEDKI